MRLCGFWFFVSVDDRLEDDLPNLWMDVVHYAQPELFTVCIAVVVHVLQRPCIFRFIGSERGLDDLDELGVPGLERDPLCFFADLERVRVEPHDMYMPVIMAFE